MDIAKLRAWWFHRQGLDGSLAGKPSAEVLESTGWARSVGGANPYLALFARSGIRREAVDLDVESAAIHELPSARNCTYVVPRAHYAIALRLARGEGDPPDIATAKRHLGVTEAEIATLSEKVQRVLEVGPLDPKEMKEPLGDAVRSLGDEGKKRGIGTTLPMVLGILQTEGKIRRIPANGRLDNQRFKYSLWKDSPTVGTSLTLAEATAAFARAYFSWIGPASKSSFAGIAGISGKAADAAIAGLGLVPIEEGSDLLAFPETREAFEAFVPPKEPQIVLASNLDGLSHLRWGQIQTLVDEADRGRHVFGPKGLGELGGLSELESHAIYDRGRLIGVWEFDQSRGEVAWMSFIEPHDALRAAVRRMEAFGREELGDIRSFSLDSPESRKPRIEAIRSA